MAIDVVNAPRWRVSVEDAAALAPLRDYFRRLGHDPQITGPLAFDLETASPEAELAEYVASWVNVNVVAVRLLPAKDEPTSAPDALQPLLLPPPRIGELLVRKGFITEEQLAAALKEARETKQLLGVVLLRKQLIFEDELARTLSEQLSIPYLRIGSIGVNNHVARLLPYDAGMRAAAIPVRGEGETVQVAFADPTDPEALAAVREHLPKINVAVAELSDIKAALRAVVASGAS